MKNINDIKNKIEKENIKTFTVGISNEVLNNGIDLYNVDSFIDFMKYNKINISFISALFEEYKDHLITNEIIYNKLGKYGTEEFYDIISEDIEKYNKKVCEIDFNIPFMYIFACLYEGKYFYIKIDIDRGVDESFLMEPKDKLNEILSNNTSKLEKKQEELDKNTKDLIKELKEIILNDGDFYKCTNKHLRFVYIKDLLTNKLDDHFEPLKKLWLSDTIRGICQGPIDLVEMLWRESKNK